MTVETILNDKQLTAVVEGRIDTLTAPDLEKKLLAAIEGVDSLLVDFSAVPYISSAGFRSLLAVKKAMIANNNDKMKLINVSDAINDIFEETGFIDIFDIEK
ncbi:MAG: STAS domain-containing protein [Ruminococcus sp.]|nr:STAS domain-containing protein [Ruminococcus sp.]